MSITPPDEDLSPVAATAEAEPTAAERAAALRTAGGMAAALRELFPPKEYAVLFDVANGTGGRISRRADCLVQSLWPSRGCTLWGVEIKVERGDWLREKKDPAKAEAIAGYCDGFLLAVPDAALVAPAELPAGWGLIAPKKGRAAGTLHVLRLPAPPPASPRPVDRSFLAAMLRAALAQAPREGELERARAEARASGFDAGKRHATWEGQRAVEALAKLREGLAAFNASADVDLFHLLDRYRGEQAGKLARALMHYGQAPADAIRQARNLVRRAMESLDEADALVRGGGDGAKEGGGDG